MTHIPEPAEPGLETDPLYNLILRDSFRQLFKALTRTERLIAILRALTWTDQAIADTLGMRPAAVSGTIQRARRRLIASQPTEIAGMLRGRQRRTHTHRHVHDPHANLSTHQAAQILQTTPQQITRLCRQGRFPNARRRATPPHTWTIPAKDLTIYRPP